jgi:hypothetical protein
MTASRGKLLHHVIVPIALLVVLSMALVVAFIWFSARTQDDVALMQSIETMRDAVSRQLAKIGLAAKDYDKGCGGCEAERGIAGRLRAGQEIVIRPAAADKAEAGQHIGLMLGKLL